MWVPTSDIIFDEGSLTERGYGIFLLFILTIRWSEGESLHLSVWGEIVGGWISNHFNQFLDRITLYRETSSSKRNKYVLTLLYLQSAAKSNSTRTFGVPWRTLPRILLLLSIDMWPKQLLIEFVHTLDGGWMCIEFAVTFFPSFNGTFLFFGKSSLLWLKLDYQIRFWSLDFKFIFDYIYLPDSNWGAWQSHFVSLLFIFSICEGYPHHLPFFNVHCPINSIGSLSRARLVRAKSKSLVPNHTISKHCSGTIKGNT